MISIAVIALLFILLIVFCVISAKNWHWSNIVFLILTYISGVAASVGLAKVLDGRSKVLKAVSTSEARLNKTLDELDFTLFGPADSLTFSEDSLRGRTAALQLQLHGRGRVWSGTVTDSGEVKTFTFPQSRDATDGNPVSLKGVVLFAFLNEVIDGTLYPKTFMGTVRVTTETAESWTLKSEFLVNQELFDQEGLSWSLFEKMPADRHDTFTNLVETDVQDEAFDIGAYRTLLETDFFPASTMGFAIDSPDAEVARESAIAYERFIDQIAFDGMSLGRIENWIESAQRVSGDFVPLPEELFVEYQFTKKSSSDSPFLVDADR